MRSLLSLLQVSAPCHLPSAKGSPRPVYALLLVIIYVAFIGLGLPDSLVGAGWPIMHHDLGVPVAFAGIITMIIASGTIVSSLASERVSRRFGAGAVTAVSVGMTAAALFGSPKLTRSGCYACGPSRTGSEPERSTRPSTTTSPCTTPPGT